MTTTLSRPAETAFGHEGIDEYLATKFAAIALERPRI